MGMAVKKTEILLNGYVSARRRATHPVPLKSMAYDIEIVSGLAVIKQTRVFRNDEKQPIEATMTFPVGYESTVCDVRATVAGRVLVGQAKAKKEARETYEKALDDGKATVLHEELMRGLHMVSAGNIAPGAEVVIEATSVTPLALVSGIGRLRIPLTIGAIYGTSPLLPSDDIVADGAALDAGVTVRGADGVLVNGLDASGVTTVRTSAVIDIQVTHLALRPIQAKMPSGSWARVSMGVPSTSDHPVDVDLMLDTSGSMAERGQPLTKWQGTVKGLEAALVEARSEDQFRFWTFSDHCVMRGSAKGPDASKSVSAVPFDNMGTMLAEAVHKVASSRPEANILLVTDGKSHTPIDFDLVRKSGARFTIVLVGRASFESRVAQLAAVTGGQMFVVDGGDDVAGAVRAALTSMRSAASPVKANANPEATVERTIGGLEVSVSYGSDKEEGLEEFDRASAFAASLAVSALPVEEAGRLAEAAGIVTHLTSIVMVDHDGPEVDGIAVNRKVALAESDEGATMSLLGGGAMMFASAAGGSPRSAMRSMSLVGSAHDGASTGALESFGAQSAGDVGAMWNESLSLGVSAPKSIMRGGPTRSRTTVITTTVVETDTSLTVDPIGSLPMPPFGPVNVIDWANFDWTVASEVLNGQPLALFGAFERAAVEVLALRAEVVALARSLGKNAQHVAIALIAKARGGSDRQALRIVRKVLDKADAGALAAAVAVIP